jgi:hypothetical protein
MTRYQFHLKLAFYDPAKNYLSSHSRHSSSRCDRPDNERREKCTKRPKTQLQPGSGLKLESFSGSECLNLRFAQSSWDARKRKTVRESPLEVSEAALTRCRRNNPREFDASEHSGDEKKSPVRGQEASEC